MGLFHWLIDTIAPIFLILSPITSYADQIISIRRTRTSAGFSLDIPLIMLLASILKVFYWFGVHYDRALLVQALIMIIMQSILLHFALTFRPNPSAIASDESPFAPPPDLELPRPHNFWRWRTAKPYWLFLGYFLLGLILLQLIFGHSTSYAGLVGAVALAIEAVLPVPQILANHRRRGCKGFRLSVLANWLIGDAFKMLFFIAKGANEVPWAFKLCGMFQAACDVYLGVQFYNFGDGEPGNEGRIFQDDVRWVRERSIELVGWNKRNGGL